ncbi:MULTISPECIES: hypothetical protein [Clostridium]|uniref:hypothetical protein n=1 Tax=Clostridium TaxID=1485 RepID=UPI000826E1FA|nr:MULTISPECIES: hypothetical protein [Clostridium]PJI06597.1 hypothetical protein CUB90_01385 [Clostridium sp. CT7]
MRKLDSMVLILFGVSALLQLFFFNSNDILKFAYILAVIGWILVFVAYKRHKRLSNKKGN